MRPRQGCTYALAAGINMHGDACNDGGGTGGGPLGPELRMLPGLLCQLVLMAIVGSKGQQGSAQAVHLLQRDFLSCLAQLLKALQPPPTHQVNLCSAL